VYERRDGGQRLLVALNARGKAADLRFTVEAAPADNGAVPFAVAFTGFASAEALEEAAAAAAAPAEAAGEASAAAMLEEETVTAAKAAAVACGGESAWTTLFSSTSALAAGSALESNANGQLKLSLPAYGYIILQQVTV
jgi:hypothetical protein